MDTIISVILSSIIAILITWYFTRKQMKKNEITHFSINSYDVGKGLHNEFPKFQITYERKEISNELQVLKGGFLNSGRNDIVGLKNDSDINLILPEGCSLKDIKIKQLSSDLDVTACKSKKTPNIVNFAINEKFMAGESFEYTAIIETTKEIKNLHRKIEFKHRIPNTSRIRDEYIVGQGTQKGSPIGSKAVFPLIKEKNMGFMTLVAAVLFCSVSLFYFFVQRVQYSVIEKETDKEYSLFMTPQSQLYISDNELVPFWDNIKITKAELDNNYILSIKTNTSWKSENSLIGFLLAFMALVYFIGAVLSFYLWNKKKQIYNLLKQYEQE